MRLAEKGERTSYHLVKCFLEASVRFRVASKRDKLRLSWPSSLVTGDVTGSKTV